MPEFARNVSEVVDIRLHEPERIRRLLAARRRRPQLVPDNGRLMIIAADHPARGALTVGGRAVMGSRSEFLARLVAALARPGVDGVLATADVVEDLVLLGALEEKVVFASMNRGGLARSVFEADDRLTAYDVAGAVESGLDGGKMLLRIDLDDPATVATLAACGRMVTELNHAGRIALVEPFMARQGHGGLVNDLSPDAVITSIHIAQGLGASTAYTWLKIPVVEEMERVVDATTFPTLLLGGDRNGPAEATFAGWQAALELPTVRGLVVGRALLYPPDDDVEGAVDAAADLVRKCGV